MLAIVGFVSLLVIMYLLISGKAIPLAVFTIVPLLVAVIIGADLKTIVEFVTKGVGSTWQTAVLFIFSILFFSIMTDAGLFDKLVGGLLKISGNNVLLLMIATGIIAVVGHLDGSATTTYLITVPALLPVYRRLKANPLILLLITGAATGVMNLVPWGGLTGRVASVTKIDGNILWKAMIPMQILGLVAVFVIAIYYGIKETRRLKKEGLLTSAKGEDVAHAITYTEEELSWRRPKLLWFNLLLTVGLIVVLMTIKLPLYSVFLVATVIALVVNYPDIKLQTKNLQKNASSVIMLSATLIAAGIFLGVYVHSGIIKAMTEALISIIPKAVQPYLHIVIGALGAPIGMTMGPDPYYFAIMPLIGNVVAPFGVALEKVGYAMLIGENAALACSPAIPVTFLLIGLGGVELKDHIKFSFLWLWGISLVMLVFAVVTGIV